MRLLTTAAVVLATFTVHAGEIDPSIPEGWARNLGGGPDNVPGNCEAGSDMELVDSGQNNMTVRCPRPVVIPEDVPEEIRAEMLEQTAQAGYAALYQMFPANDWRGKRIRFTALLRTEGIEDASLPEGMTAGSRFSPSNRRTETGDVKGVGGLWVRVGRQQAALVVDNMRDRGVVGTTDWAPQEVVLDVPADALSITIGFWMQGRGQIWMTSPSFEEVDESMPVTAEPSSADARPTNLGQQ
jgi:hypothetical protein